MTFKLKNLFAWVKYQIRLVRVGARRGNPLFVGIGSTKLFLSVICVLALLPQKIEGVWSWRIWSFLISPPNEIGDTFAGLAGALAFLWIIVTVMLQSKELAAQRDELRLARKEFNRMAKAQEKQESLHREQYRVLSENSKIQDADREFDELIQAVKQNLYSIEGSWLFETPVTDEQSEPSVVEISFAKDESKGDPHLFADLAHHLWSLTYDLKAAMRTGFLLSSPQKISEYPSLIVPPINRLVVLKPDLSAAKSTKFTYLGIDRIKTHLDELNSDDWWLNRES